MAMSPAIGRRRLPAVKFLVGLALTAAVTVAAWEYHSRSAARSASVEHPAPIYQPRQPIDTSGLVTVFKSIQVPWRPNASLAEISRFWQRFGYRDIESIDEALADPMLSDDRQFDLLMTKASLY